jgi:hypothetical protein
MHDVCDTWNSPWAALQKTLAGAPGVLLEASLLAEVSWRRACVRLAEFDAPRDVLEKQMSAPAAREASAA